MNNNSKLPISLNLKQVNPLPDRIKKYFDICLEKLGLIPNVLLAYSHNTNKLDTFTNMYNEIMLSDSGLSKLQREMIAVVVKEISPIVILYNYSIDDGVPRSSPNQFSNEIRLLVCKWKMKRAWKLYFI